LPEVAWVVFIVLITDFVAPLIALALTFATVLNASGTILA